MTAKPYAAATTRRRFLLLLGAVALALAAWFAYWQTRLLAFEREVATWSRPDHPGFRLVHEGIGFSGFPYRLEARIENARLLRDHPDYQLVLTARTLTVLTQPWKQDLRLGFANDAQLRLVSGSLAPLEAGQASASIAAPDVQISLRTRADGGVERLSLVFNEAQIALPGLGLAGFTAKDVQLHGRQVPQGPVAATDPRGPALLQAVVAARGLGRGDKMQRGDISMDIVVHAGSASAPARLAAWAVEGGSIAIPRFELIGGKLKVSGDATLALDRKGSLSAAGTLATNDPAAVRQFLTTGALKPSRLKQPESRAPFSVVDGGLTFGGNALRPVPPLSRVSSAPASPSGG